MRFDYAEGPQTDNGANSGVNPLETETPRAARGKKTPPRKRVSVVDLAEAEPEETRRPWRPRPSVYSRPEEGEVVEAAESADDTIPTQLVESLNLPGSSGAQPLSVSKAISDEISGWMTNGISTEASKAISKEFPIEFIDTDFAIKPPKLDGWIGRRAQLRPDKSPTYPPDLETMLCLNFF